MVAFSGAVDMGIRHLETDLRMTSDGVVVCFHDRTLERTTDGVGEVATVTYAELSRLDAGYRHAPENDLAFRGQGVTVPTLEELVTSFPETALIVDLKQDGMAAEVARLIAQHVLHDRIVVGSFSDRRLAEFRSIADGKISTSTGQRESRNWLAASRLGRVLSGPAVALQVPVTSRGVRVVDARLIEVAHRAGLHVHVWTVNQESEMVRLLDLGVDGVITDRPDLLLGVLSERVET